MVPGMGLVSANRRAAASAGLAPVARFRTGNTGSATSLRGLIQEHAGLVEGLPQGRKAAIETDEVEQVAMLLPMRHRSNFPLPRWMRIEDGHRDFGLWRRTRRPQSSSSRV